MSRKTKVLATAPALILVVLIRTFFTVDETEHAVVTQFGRPVRTIVSAGLKVKWPWQSLLVFERRLMVYNPRPGWVLDSMERKLCANLCLEKDLPGHREPKSLPRK